MDAGPMTSELALGLLESFERAGITVWVAGGWGIDAPDGSATQSGLDGTRFDYPASAFTVGTIAGRTVGCLSAAQQRLFHSGYDLRDIDRQDLAALDGIGR